jgi:hypothetical protein
MATPSRKAPTIDLQTELARDLFGWQWRDDWQAWCPPDWPNRTAMGLWQGQVQQEMLLALKRHGGAMWPGAVPLDDRGRPILPDYVADANATELIWGWIVRCGGLGHVRFQFPPLRVLCVIAWGEAHQVEGTGSTRAEALCRAALALAAVLRQQSLLLEGMAEEERERRASASEGVDAPE